jgi:hypothetical protein
VKSNVAKYDPLAKTAMRAFGLSPQAEEKERRD